MSLRSRSLFLAAPLAVAVLISCTQAGGPTSPGTHDLTIQNNTSSDLEFVSWTDDAGTSHEFISGKVYDSALSKFVDGLPVAAKATCEVATGADRLVFFFADGGVGYRTAFDIIVSADDPAVQFTLTDTTSVEERP